MLAENPNTQLSPGQVEAMLRNVVNRRLTKLERIALAAKGAPGFEVDQARSDDKRAFWTYSLLDAQGATAVVCPEDRIRMASGGLSDADIAAVQDHLAMLRINELVPTKHHILRQMVEGVEGASTSMESADHFDRTQAHEIGYFPILQGEKGKRDRWLIARPRYRFFPSPAQQALLPSHSISCVTRDLQRCTVPLSSYVRAWIGR